VGGDASESMGVEIVQMLSDEALVPLELQVKGAVGGDTVVPIGAPPRQLRLREPVEVSTTLLISKSEFLRKTRHRVGLHLKAPEYPELVLV
jgi:hypothetical protein